MLALAGGTLLTGCAPEPIGPVLAKDVELVRTFKAANAVPADRVRQAKAIAILDRFEAAAVVGASGGEGVMVKRLPNGWSPPLAISVVSGSLGLQLGGRDQQLVILFMDDAAVERFITDGAYSLAQAVGTGGTASAEATASSQSQGVEVYSRSGGLFGSAAVGGVGFSVNESRNRATYGVSANTRRILEGRVEPPPGAQTLWAELNALEG